MAEPVSMASVLSPEPNWIAVPPEPMMRPALTTTSSRALTILMAMPDPPWMSPRIVDAREERRIPLRRVVDQDSEAGAVDPRAGEIDDVAATRRDAFGGVGQPVGPRAAGAEAADGAVILDCCTEIDVDPVAVAVIDAVRAAAVFGTGRRAVDIGAGRIREGARDDSVIDHGRGAVRADAGTVAAEDAGAGLVRYRGDAGLAHIDAVAVAEDGAAGIVADRPARPVLELDAVGTLNVAGGGTAPDGAAIDEIQLSRRSARRPRPGTAASRHCRSRRGTRPWSRRGRGPGLCWRRWSSRYPW